MKMEGKEDVTGRRSNSSVIWWDMQSGSKVLGTYRCTLSNVGHQVLGTGGLSSGERVIPLGFCCRGVLEV